MWRTKPGFVLRYFLNSGDFDLVFTGSQTAEDRRQSSPKTDHLTEDGQRNKWAPQRLCRCNYRMSRKKLTPCTKGTAEKIACLKP